MGQNFLMGEMEKALDRAIRIQLLTTCHDEHFLRPLSELISANWKLKSLSLDSEGALGALRSTFRNGSGEGLARWTSARF